MCLIAFNWMDHPEYRLILVGNRDEFFDRPSASLHLWTEGFYAGKDLKGGGTWMGFHPSGRFATLTNYRSAGESMASPISRGHLVKDFLHGEHAPLDYLQQVQQQMHQYEGFNLLVAEGEQMAYLSNYRKEAEIVAPGIHGISNAFLDSPWPKVVQAVKQLEGAIAGEALNVEQLLQLLQSKSYAPDELLPATGISLEMERILSAQFIHMGQAYGTVNTTAMLWKHNGEVVIKERRTKPLEETEVTLSAKQP
ncbi:MAG TPA: NRDE family protein [Cyclobacteriaceae bacterium]|nr:NRDE family protein [Cyclobacteriaceae bacterium]